MLPTVDHLHSLYYKGFGAKTVSSGYSGFYPPVYGYSFCVLKNLSGNAGNSKMKSRLKRQKTAAAENISAMRGL